MKKRGVYFRLAEGGLEGCSVQMIQERVVQALVPSWGLGRRPLLPMSDPRHGAALIVPSGETRFLAGNSTCASRGHHERL